MQPHVHALQYNLRKLQRLARMLQTLGHPFVLAGDFNMTPDRLAASGGRKQREQLRPQRAPTPVPQRDGVEADTSRALEVARAHADHFASEF